MRKFLFVILFCLTVLLNIYSVIPDGMPAPPGTPDSIELWNYTISSNPNQFCRVYLYSNYKNISNGKIYYHGKTRIIIRKEEDDDSAGAQYTLTVNAYSGGVHIGSRVLVGDDEDYYWHLLKPGTSTKLDIGDYSSVDVHVKIEKQHFWPWKTTIFSDQKILTLTRDDTAPSIIIDEDYEKKKYSNGWTRGKVTFDLSGSDPETGIRHEWWQYYKYNIPTTTNSNPIPGAKISNFDSENNTATYEITEEGMNNVTFSVQNNVKHKTFSDKWYEVKIDNTPPNNVTEIYAYPDSRIFEYYGIKIGRFLSRFHLYFRGVSDVNENIGSSLVQKYNMYIKNDFNNEIVKNLGYSGAGVKEINIPYSYTEMNRYSNNELGIPNNYNIYLRAVDGVDLEAEDYAITTLHMPPQPVMFGGENPIKFLKPEIEGSNVNYPVEFTFNITPEGLKNKFQGVKVYYVDKNSGNNAVQIPLSSNGTDNMGNAVYKGKITNTFFPNGVDLAHKDLTFITTSVHLNPDHPFKFEQVLINNQIINVHQIVVKNAPTYEEDIEERGEERTVKLPNFSPSDFTFSIRETENTGVEKIFLPDGTINSETSTFTSSNEIEFLLNSYYNDDPSNWYDHEGDILKIEPMTINGYSLSNYESYGKDNLFELYHDINLVQHLYLKINEFPRDSTSDLFSVYEGYANGETEYDPSKYRAVTTIHNDNDGNKEGFYIYWDHDTPYGRFYLLSQDYIYDETERLPSFTIDNASDSEDVNIYIMENLFNDLENEFEIFNVNPAVFDYPEYIQGEDILGLKNKIEKEIEEGKVPDFTFEEVISNKKVINDISSVGQIFGSDNNKWKYNFTLDDFGTGTDYRIVCIKINNTYLTQVIKVDMVPPSDITGISYVTDSNDRSITVNLIADNNEEDVIFHLEYENPLNPGEIIDLTSDRVNTADSSIIIDISGYKGNTHIPVTAYAVDMAGNRSENTFKYNNIYTPVYINLSGSELENLTEQKYDLTSDIRYLEWILPQSVIDNIENIDDVVFRVKYQDITNGNPDYSLSVPSDNPVRLTGILKNHSYNLIILAFNSFEEPTDSETFTYNVANYAPTASEIVYPVDSGFAEKVFILEWAKSDDADNDDITYTLNIENETVNTAVLNSYTENEDGNLEAEINSSLYNFLHEGEYTLWITSDDGSGSTDDSEKITFTTDDDTRDPGDIIKFIYPDENILKIGENTVKVEITPSISGITSIEYTDINNNYVTVDGPWSVETEIDIPVEDENGIRNINVKSVTGAGREIEVTSADIFVDRISPVISGFNVSLKVLDNINYSKTKDISFSVSYDENLGSLQYLEYVFTDEIPSSFEDLTGWVRSESLTGIGNISFNTGSSGPVPFTGKINTDFEDGTRKYLFLRGIDWGENESNILDETDLIVFDMSNPDGKLNLTGCEVYNSGYFVSSKSLLSILPDFKDDDSGIDDTQTVYSVVRFDNTDDIIWSDSFNDAVTGFAPINGEKYKIASEIENKAGLKRIIYSEPFTYDSTPAGDIQITFDNEKAYLPGESVTIEVTADEEDSKVIEYKLSVGIPGSLISVSENILGNKNGYLVNKEGKNHTVFIFNLPENIISHDYLINVEVINASGLPASIEGTNPIIVNTEQERVIIEDSSPYQRDKTLIKASWKYVGENTVTSYEYRIIGFSENTPGFIPVNDEYINLTGLTLTDGDEYHIEVRAVYEDGSVSETTIGEKVTVDSVKPQIISFTTEEAYNSNNLNVNWHTEDDISGIGKVEILVESLDSNNNRYVVGDGWIELEVSEEAENVSILTDNAGNKLNFINNQRIYLSLCVSDNAGSSSVMDSGLIIIDENPAPSSYVADQADFIKTEEYLEASWIIFDDEESLIDSVKWKIVSDPENIDDNNWHEDNGTNSILFTDELENEIGFVKTHGDTWYFAVKVTDIAGNSSIGLSNGITFDDNAPYLSSVKLLRNTSEASQYLNSLNDLKLNIEAHENESVAPSSYSVSAGYWSDQNEWINNSEYESGISIIDLVDPVLDSGKINFFRGNCLDDAGNVSSFGYTNPVIYDIVNPEFVYINGSYKSGEIFFDWKTINTKSGIDRYDLLLTKDTLEIYTGSTNKQKITVNRDLIESEIEDGTYVLNITAYNKAGNSASTSKTVFIDTTVPSIESFDYDKYISDSLTFSVVSENDLSGISEYRYCLGTLKNPDIFTEGWVSIFTRDTSLINRRIILEDLGTAAESITDKQKVYLSVRIVDGMGLESAVIISDPVIVDRTSSSIPVVQSETVTSFTNMIQGISVTSEDLESEITAFDIAVTDNTSDTNLNWKTVTGFTGKSLEVSGYTLTGLNLENTRNYYVAVRVENSAGVYSETGFSNAVTVDTDKPAISFENNENELVYNSGSEFNINFTIEKRTKIIFKLELTTGNVEEIEFYEEGFTDENGYTEPGSYTLTVNNLPLISISGIYYLTARLEDEVPNIVESSSNHQRIRVNDDHDIIFYADLGHYITNPGRPVTLYAEVSDDDGDTDFTYFWEVNGQTSDVETPEFILLHSDPHNQETTYPVTLTVTDENGLEVTSVINLVVENTRRGRLYVDEYWSAVHYITGDIIIPDGITLTVVEGTEVIMMGSPLQTYDHQILVNGNLDISDGAVFRMVDDNISFWKGFYVDNKSSLYTNEADFNGVIIKDAFRGITVVPDSNTNINSCIFVNDVIGIHVIGIDQLITNCKFIFSPKKQNAPKKSFIGIKEDKGASPVVQGCEFIHNNPDYFYMDYYDEDKTGITIEDLNNLKSSNYDNVKTGGVQ